MREDTMQAGGSRGFTFIEMAIVLALVAIIIGMSIPTISGSLSHYRLNTASQCLISDLRLARQLALKENRSVRVNFTSQRDYQLERRVGLGWELVQTAVDFSNDHSRQGVLFTGLPAPVEFDYMGRTGQAASIGLVNGRGESTTIQISTTGRIVEN
jgi:prepilin-type N-terminal cleavage/methylation domain-containing protein